MLPVLFLAPMFADLVVRHARIWTDGHLTKATMLAVRGGQIVYVGADAASYVGRKTRVVDAGNRLVTPGIIDSHTHVAESGPSFKYDLDLRPAVSRDDFVRRVRDWNVKLPQGVWMTGGGWSVESYPDKSTPSRAWIDAATGDRPTVLTRMDGHSLLANTAALKKAGITRDTKAPAGGSVERGPDGEPTGILTDTAMGLAPVPGPTAAQAEAGLRAAVAEANRYGVTAVGDVVGDAQVGLVTRYTRTKDRSLRFALYRRVDDPSAVTLLTKGFKGVPGWTELRGIKLYMDGSLGSRSAYMAAPYDKPLPSQPKDWRGLPRAGATDGTYRRIMTEAAKANLQVIVHAIGDGANRGVLNLFAAVPGIQGRRFRVEHAQHLLPADIPRFARLGVIPSMQPYHKADDGRYCEEVIGTARSRTSYAFRDLVRAKARLAFGSDFDVVTIDPWIGIHTAVTGQILGGKIWMPHQNLTFDQALDAYTRAGAYAMFRENDLGRLAKGYRADFVILEGEPYRSTKGLKPAATYVDGRRAFGKL